MTPLVIVRDVFGDKVAWCTKRERVAKIIFLIKLFFDLIITKSLLNDTKKEGKKRKIFFGMASRPLDLINTNDYFM